MHISLTITNHTDDWKLHRSTKHNPQKKSSCNRFEKPIWRGNTSIENTWRNPIRPREAQEEGTNTFERRRWPTPPAAGVAKSGSQPARRVPDRINEFRAALRSTQQIHSYNSANEAKRLPWLRCRRNQRTDSRRKKLESKRFWMESCYRAYLLEVGGARRSGGNEAEGGDKTRRSGRARGERSMSRIKTRRTHRDTITATNSDSIARWASPIAHRLLPRHQERQSRTKSRREPEAVRGYVWIVGP